MPDIKHTGTSPHLHILGLGHWLQWLPWLHGVPKLDALFDDALVAIFSDALRWNKWKMNWKKNKWIGRGENWGGAADSNEMEGGVRI